MEGLTDFERFVGVWELKGIEDSEDSEETEEKTFLESNRAGAPAVGFERPAGLLIYVASGHMSVNFAGSSRIPFLSESSPSPSELAAAGAAYGGYAGQWELDEARRQVLHHVKTAFIPNRVGTTLRRSYSFEENRLVLRPPPTLRDGMRVERVLVWGRLA